MTIIIRSVFEESGKRYPQVFYMSVCLSYKNFIVQKINFSEGIDINKTSASNECMLCHYWYFKEVGFKFEPHVCNKCHDILMTAHELKTLQY